jgi:hypothetical protein
MTFKEVESLLGHHWLEGPGSLWQPTVVIWYDDDDYFVGNCIVVTFKNATSWKDEVVRKEFHRTELPLYARLKRRSERRIRVLWP